MSKATIALCFSFTATKKAMTACLSFSFCYNEEGDGSFYFGFGGTKKKFFYFGFATQQRR